MRRLFPLCHSSLLCLGLFAERQKLLARACPQPADVAVTGVAGLLRQVMPKRRLQCGSCSTVIKVSSRIYRPVYPRSVSVVAGHNTAPARAAAPLTRGPAPVATHSPCILTCCAACPRSSRPWVQVCPRCQTAHTFIKCGRAECGTLMCLPENVNQFSCPRCNVQLARPGHAQLKANPIAVRCGNLTCDFLMTIPGNVGRFRCPRCQMEQVLPGTEEALKCKARYEEEMRQKALKQRHQEELQGLCEIFYTMDASIVEAVYETADKQRSLALQQLMDMAGDTPALQSSLRAEALRLHTVMLEKKNLVEDSMRCPISGDVMQDPVIGTDGHSYDRESITKHLKAKQNTSPITGETMDPAALVPNHQLRSEIESWREYKADSEAGVTGDGDSNQDDFAVESVIPAVSSRPTSAHPSSVLEAKTVTSLTNGYASPDYVDVDQHAPRGVDMEAGAPDAAAGQGAAGAARGNAPQSSGVCSV